MTATVTVGTAVDTGAPVIPTHQSGDKLILVVETQGETVTTPSGWAIVDCAPIINSTSTTLSLFELDADSAAETDPTIAGPANHYWARVLRIRSHRASDAYAAIAGMISTGATTGATWPSVRSTFDDCLVINLLAYAADSAGPISSAEANASLTGVAEIADDGTIAGGGGGHVIISGTLASAGPIASTTATISSSNYAAATLVIAPSGASSGGGVSLSRVVNA